MLTRRKVYLFILIFSLILFASSFIMMMTSSYHIGDMNKYKDAVTYGTRQECYVRANDYKGGWYHSCEEWFNVYYTSYTFIDLLHVQWVMYDSCTGEGFRPMTGNHTCYSVDFTNPENIVAIWYPMDYLPDQVLYYMGLTFVCISALINLFGLYGLYKEKEKDLSERKPLINEV